jgi:hypothetical protein
MASNGTTYALSSEHKDMLEKPLRDSDPEVAEIMVRIHPSHYCWFTSWQAT